MGTYLVTNSDNKDESFSDAAQVEGVARSTRLMSGWGLKYFDCDNDGLVDLILANGHPDDMIDSYSMQVKYKAPLLLHQGLDHKLHDVTAQAGPAFQKDWAGRGLAVGDYELKIHWPAPSKHMEKLANLGSNRYLHIVEGKGAV